MLLIGALSAQIVIEPFENELPFVFRLLLVAMLCFIPGGNVLSNLQEEI